MPNKLLDNKENDLVAFSLFSMCMKMGPISFPIFEILIDKLEVRQEFENYAKDWIEYKNRATKQPDK